jgi:hypothetical protein
LFYSDFFLFGLIILPAIINPRPIAKKNHERNRAISFSRVNLIIIPRANIINPIILTLFMFLGF